MLTHPCLAAFGRCAGTLRSVQLVKLNSDGTRAMRDGQKYPKMIYGTAKGSFVTIQHDTNSTKTYVAEGIETALSLKTAGLKGTIVASGGIHNMKNLDVHSQEIVLAADNDAGKTDKILHTIKDHLTDKGHHVRMVMPKTPGQDFNDALQKGPEAVAQYFREAERTHSQDTSKHISRGR